MDIRAVTSFDFVSIQLEANAKFFSHIISMEHSYRHGYRHRGKSSWQIHSYYFYVILYVIITGHGNLQCKIGFRYPIHDGISDPLI